MRSRSSWRTSRSSPSTSAPRRWTGSPRRSASSTTCRCCCCGARATRCSPTATCATCALGCRTRTSSATSGRRTSCWRTPRRRPPTRGRGSATSPVRTNGPFVAQVRTTGPLVQRASDAPTLWAALEARAGDPSPAVVEPGVRTISWDLLVRRVHELAAGLADHGVSPGDRVALLVPPGADLTAAAHACWRAGASSSSPTPGWVPPGSRGPCAARTRRTSSAPFPGSPSRPRWASRAAGSRPGRSRRALLGSPVTLAALARRGRALLDRGAALPAEAGPDDEAAVLFTSGATGPAKGVVYRHRQARAQIAALRAAYGITGDDRLVAAFPPFALYGPALGIPSAVPEVRKPRRPDRRRAGPRRRRGRRHDGLRLARSAPQRRRHRRRSRPGSARRPGRRPPRRVRRCAGARRAAPRAARRPAERGGAHPVRDDRGPARHRRRARRDRRRRPRQRGVRRARASRRRRRGGRPCRRWVFRTASRPGSRGSRARSASPRRT